MIIQEVINELEKIVPPVYAEDFDNVGLLVGNSETEVSKILVCHDAVEEVVEEAIEKGANLIVSFHPIIFKGLKKLTGKTYVERAVMKAIRHDISIYATHTAFDNYIEGVNYGISEALNLKNTKILIPQSDTLKELVVYVPEANADELRTALAKAGAGNIGNYDSCSFNSTGSGYFRAKDGANPYVGELGELHKENEVRVSVIFSKHLESGIMKAMRAVHPYEEIAYQIYSIENKNQNIGMGMVGDLENEMAETDFMDFLKDKMKTEVVRHSKLLNKKIKRVAVLGGSGSFAIQSAISAGADAFVTADLKYHDFYGAENRILVADIGHFESERYTKDLLTAYLSEKFINFAILKSAINTNPVYYY